MGGGYGSPTTPGKVTNYGEGGDTGHQPHEVRSLITGRGGIRVTDHTRLGH